MNGHDDADSWDELVAKDLLLPEHIEVLKVIETALKQQGANEAQQRQEMLKRAREFAAFKTSGDVFPDVPLPPEAGRVSAWEYDEAEDVWQRRYEGREFKAGAGSVQIAGTQTSDGAVSSRRLAIRVLDLLSAEDARQLAFLLQQEADAIDRFTARHESDGG